MADRNSTELSPAQQMELAERLVRHAENIRNPAAKAMKEDLQSAARLIRKWRVGIQEAIQHCHEEATRARLQKLAEGA
jgi:hypothetical protein